MCRQCRAKDGQKVVHAIVDAEVFYEKLRKAGRELGGGVRSGNVRVKNVLD